MRFGLFYEHQLPRPWSAGGEGRLLEDALEQIELADRAGFDYVWAVEHHFLEEYSHSSAPEVFLAAASQRARRIRLGHGIVQLPPGFNHPARVAERIATLDLISGGRVEFGTGEAGSQAELGGFGVERELKRAQWKESLDAITRMMVEDPFAGYDGRFVSMPPRAVVPKPAQKPHPPLWVACSRRETILLAARLGIGALSFSFLEPEEAGEWVRDYRRLIASDECVPAGFAVNPNVAVVLPMMCHPDERTAIERGIDGAHFFGYALSHYYVFGRHRPGHTSIWEEFEARRRDYGFAREIVTADQAPLGVKLLQHGLGSLRGAIGTPSQIAGLIERYERAGVDQVVFVLQAGRNRHEHILESIERFAGEVMPRFLDRHQRLEADKMAGLEGAIGRALERRLPPRTSPPGYVITTQGEPFLVRGTRPSRPSAPARLLRSWSDQRLAGLFSLRPVQWLVFEGLRSRLNVDKAGGFTGDIQYELIGNGRTHEWVVSIVNGSAKIATGRASRPVLTMRMPLEIFARLITGQVQAGAAAIDGRLELDGDYRALVSLMKMLER